jgi:hypothetical protein
MRAGDESLNEHSAFSIQIKSYRRVAILSFLFTTKDTKVAQRAERKKQARFGRIASDKLAC